MLHADLFLYSQTKKSSLSGWWEEVVIGLRLRQLIYRDVIHTQIARVSIKYGSVVTRSAESDADGKANERAIKSGRVMQNPCSSLYKCPPLAFRKRRVAFQSGLKDAPLI